MARCVTNCTVIRTLGIVQPFADTVPFRTPWQVHQRRLLRTHRERDLAAGSCRAVTSVLTLPAHGRPRPDGRVALCAQRAQRFAGRMPVHHLASYAQHTRAASARALIADQRQEPAVRRVGCAVAHGGAVCGGGLSLLLTAGVAHRPSLGCGLVGGPAGRGCRPYRAAAVLHVGLSAPAERWATPLDLRPPTCSPGRRPSAVHGDGPPGTAEHAGLRSNVVLGNALSSPTNTRRAMCGGSERWRWLHRRASALGFGYLLCFSSHGG
jgi:hypothetical protein